MYVYRNIPNIYIYIYIYIPYICHISYIPKYYRNQVGAGLTASFRYNYTLNVLA